MTNTCDLEETKHVALEKFKEIVSKPSFEFRREWGFGGDTYHVGPFVVGSYSYGRSLYLELAEVRLAQYRNEAFEWEKTRSTQTKAYKNALASHTKAVEEARKKDLLASAWDKIKEAEALKYKQEQCEKMQTKLKEDCEKLQTALALKVEKPAVTPYAIAFIEEERKRPWWRFW